MPGKMGISNFVYHAFILLNIVKKTQTLQERSEVSKSLIQEV
jgi:hypothetical protein